VRALSLSKGAIACEDIARARALSVLPLLILREEETERSSDMFKQVCRHCHHTEDVHNIQGTGECGCGCVKLVPVDRAAREARKRTWLVEVRMFVKNRWIESGTLRVKAMGASGAAALALREAKAKCLKPRTRVAQFTMTITPVRKRV
jgi:hypothetical protein